MKRKALVKMYRWQDLTRLVVNDMQQQLGLTVTNETDFHYIGGLDTKHNPFIRVDLTPVEGEAKKEG